MTTKKATWLDRETIAKVVDNMSAADLVKGSSDAAGISAAERAEASFNAAAARQGVTNGVAAMELVHARDFVYLSEQMAEVIGANSPKSDSGTDSLDSAATGD